MKNLSINNAFLGNITDQCNFILKKNPYALLKIKELLMWPTVSLCFHW